MCSAEQSGVPRAPVREADVEPALPDDELSSCDVYRAGTSEGADGVEPSGGELAERECKRAGDPVAERVVRKRHGLLGNGLRERRLEREDLDPVLGPYVPHGPTVEPGAPALRRRPLLARSEVVEVA